MRRRKSSGVPFAGWATGVAHPARCAIVGRSAPSPFRSYSFAAPSGDLRPLSPSLWRGVGHPASIAASFRFSCLLSLPLALDAPSLRVSAASSWMLPCL